MDPRNVDRGVKVRVLPGTLLRGEVNKLIHIFGKIFGLKLGTFACKLRPFPGCVFVTVYILGVRLCFTEKGLAIDVRESLSVSSTPAPAPLSIVQQP